MLVKSIEIFVETTNSNPTSFEAITKNIAISKEQVIPLQVIASYTDELSTNDISKKVSWTSSDTAVAIVSNQGRLQGVSIGQSIISARIKGVRYEFRVNVDDAKIIKLEVRRAGLPPIATYDNNKIANLHRLFSVFYFDEGAL